MKLQKIALAAVLATFSLTAMAEQGYVGAGNGGPLMSTNGGCVLSNNGKQFPECGGAETKPAPVTPAPQPPKQEVVIIRDCKLCHGKTPKAGMKKPAPKGGKPPKLKPKKR